MSDGELEYGSEEEISENHSKLVEAVSKLDKGQRVKKVQRSEPSLEVSEFHLVKSGISDSDAIRVDDLAKTLGSKGHHAEISKKLQAARKKAKVLPKPLEKTSADRVKRIVGFENTKKELKNWNAIVTKNRAAETLVFPLKNHQSVSLEPTTRFVNRFRIQSELEKELEALEEPKEDVEEEADEFPLTLQEIMEKRKEAAKFRAQQSYKEAKAHRQNKIKSKKFHRLQRKAKIKQQLKEFEELQKTDPQAALQKLEELDKTRAEERMSLRHKSTGQWAKNQQVRAKYDKETRKVLAEQLSISRALTEKIRTNENSDDEEEISTEVVKSSISDKDNPWVNGVKTSTEINEFIAGYRKYWDENNKTAREKKISETSESVKENGNVKEKENPVESVTEIYEDSKDSVDQSKVNSERKKNKENGRKISKETKESNRMIVTRKGGVKKSMKLEKVGTSEWLVEPVITKLSNGESVSKKPVDIDDLFESMEATLADRIDKKLKKVKGKLANDERNREKNNKANTGKERERRKRSRDEMEDLSFRKEIVRPDLDDGMDESTGISGNQAKKVSLSEDPQIEAKPAERTSNEIDPNKFINVKPKHLMTMMPDDVMPNEEALDDDERDNDQRNVISEAFADDDVVDEFRKEKAEEIKKSEGAEIDLRLPGWGSWGGKNIKSKRKKRRFIIKIPKVARRRDENKGDVVIIEENDSKIRQHQVSELPHPFTSVKDFETSIRAPIGRNFVPENAHKRFIRPAVKTKMGAIIEPMDADALISKKPKRAKLAVTESTIKMKNN